MLPEIKALLIVQDRDQKIARLNKDLQRIPLEEENAKARLEGDLSSVSAAQEKVQGSEVAIKNIELDVQTRQDTIVKLKNQQFETRKNEEYRALGHEVEKYEREVEELEDKELELMEVAETHRSTLKAAEEKLKATQGLVDDELKALVDRAEACRNQITEIEEERKALVADIDETLLGQYDRLFKSKSDCAVAPLKGGICGGCHMKVTSSTAHSVKAAQKVTECENCGRLLYLDD